MTDDPDELRYEQAVQYKDPAFSARRLEGIETELHYGMTSLKVLGWVVIVLLGLILWRVW